MKGWREHAADIFTKHGEIAAKKKFDSGPQRFQTERTLPMENIIYN